MNPDPVRRWRIPPQADLRHREWDGEHVFFHGAAGDTHRMSEAAALVLLHLTRLPASEAELAQLLADAADAEPAEAAALLGGILEELARLEFTEPAP
jgi:PqqD family protein of HPr-rel-A system